MHSLRPPIRATLRNRLAVVPSIAVLVTAVVLSVPSPSFATAQLQDAGAYGGISFSSMGAPFGTGVSFVDIDGDYDLDIFLINGTGQPNRLYINQGGFSFLEAPGAWGAANLRQLARGSLRRHRQRRRQGPLSLQSAFGQHALTAMTRGPSPTSPHWPASRPIPTPPAACPWRMSTTTGSWTSTWPIEAGSAPSRISFGSTTATGPSPTWPRPGAWTPNISPSRACSPISTPMEIRTSTCPATV